MKFLLALVASIAFFPGWAQDEKGSVAGVLLDDSKKPLTGASISLQNFQNSSTQVMLTSKDGSFVFSRLALGYYKLTATFVGFSSLTIDSIYLHEERYSINLNELSLSPSSSANMDAVIVYAEKPLVQSKDGNLTFNASESPLSAGSNASDLLATVPLVSKDPSGKLLVRGKEPKILIDDKPVELNLQQLQDLLESLPGSAIEKIEVLTNPPPQYANETSVINIVTKKGRVGQSGRISVYGGTMGEKGTNLSYNYRKQGLSVSIYTGAASAIYTGTGYSVRENRYPDSINHFKSNNSYTNNVTRPNFRTNIDYDLSKNHAINFILQYNQANNLNHGITEYRNFNRADELYRYSTRDIESDNDSYSPNLSLNYTFRSKKPGEIFRIFSNVHFSSWKNDRELLLTSYHPDLTILSDSLQVQYNSNRIHGYNVRLAYDLPLAGQKTFLSLGSFYTASNSRVIADAAYKKKPDNEMVSLEALSNDFYFHQYITNGRIGLKHILSPGFSISSGLAAEFTAVEFELFKNDSASKNNYQNLLPYFTLNKNWEEKLNLTVTYRKTIRRPGINEQNPSIDYSDPYNIRFGNPQLVPASTHNFDVIAGKTKKNFYINFGLGYNTLKDIFSQIRTPVSDSKTETSWQNISDKHEYEVSSWSGYTFWKKLRINISASYIYNEYLRTKQNANRFINAGSLTSNFNANYTLKEIYSFTGFVTYNRFANPQGTFRANVSMNLGAQVKMFQKKLVLSANLIDPFNQQENRSFTYGKTFFQENYRVTRTRNFRLTIAYNFIAAAPKKNVSKEELKKILRS